MSSLRSTSSGQDPAGRSIKIEGSCRLAKDRYREEAFASRLHSGQWSGQNNFLLSRIAFDRDETNQRERIS
jgi:hypothetical protein